MVIIPHYHIARNALCMSYRDRRFTTNNIMMYLISQQDTSSFIMVDSLAADQAFVIMRTSAESS